MRQHDRGVVVIGGSIERGDLTGQSLTSCSVVTIIGNSFLHLVVSRCPLKLPSGCLLARSGPLALPLGNILCCCPLSLPFGAALCWRCPLVLPFALPYHTALRRSPLAIVLLSMCSNVCINVHYLPKVGSMAPKALSTFWLVRLRLRLTLRIAVVLFLSSHH